MAKAMKPRTQVTRKKYETTPTVSEQVFELRTRGGETVQLWKEARGKLRLSSGDQPTEGGVTLTPKQAATVAKALLLGTK